jgi:NTE family protein
MRARIALALGSGGARGYAHIGVIEELEKRGYEIVAVSGTSIGAMVGGVYAAGELEAFTKWVRKLSQGEVFRLMDPSLSAPGALKAEKVMKRVRLILGGARIEELKIPYTAVATDLLASKEVWFQEGPVDAAIRASIAIPSIISCVTINGRLLADGGLLNPVPIAPLASIEADAVFAVSLSGPGKNYVAGHPLVMSADKTPYKERTDTQMRPKIPRGVSTFDVINRSIENMQDLITRYRVAGYPPDLMIEVPVDSIGMLDFHRADSQIELGRKLAVEALDRFESQHDWMFPA